MRERYFEAIEFENIKEIIYNSAKKYKDNIAFILKEKNINIKDTKNDKNNEDDKNNKNNKNNKNSNCNKDKKNNKNNECVKYNNITYKTLLEEINSLGTKFFDMGYKNKRIAIVGRNRYEWALTHLTNMLGGIVSIPLDKELQMEELESSLKRSKADIVVFDEKYIDNIEEIKKRKNTYVEEYICMEKKEGYKNIKTLKEEGEKILKAGNKDYVDVKIDSYKMNILLFTSGTTSKSKAVMLSQNNIASNVYAMQLVENFLPDDVNLAFLPFHHIFGSTAMIVMLACGITTAFPDGLRYVADNLKEYKVSVFVGVPLLVEAIYKKIEQGIEKKGKTKIVKFAKSISNILMKVHIDIRRKLFKEIIDELGGHLRFVVSGGAPLDKKVAKGFNEMGISLVQGYGLTETAPVIAAENYKKVKYGSIGIPMDNVEVEIENKDENGIGELKVKGPNVMLGYYENEEATKEILKDGWLYTGDLGYIDNDGFLFITGRKKDMIVLKNGKKVFPDELEILVNRLDEVEESIVFGMPDNKDKNDIKISVKIVYNKEFIKEKYGDIGIEEVKNIIWEKIKKINKTFPPYKYIKNIILTNKELIKTTTKKIKRQEEIKSILEN